MLLSISFDPDHGPSGDAGFGEYQERIAALSDAAPDFVVLGRETPEGAIAPGRLEAVVALPWVATQLPNSAVIATIPALHSVPFHISRALSAADFVSAGRTGWLPSTARHELFDHAYGKGYAVDAGQVVPKYEDFIRATQALWDSWDDDALILDKASGRYLDSDKVRRVDYRGVFFSTMGPLNAARPPQGHPLLMRDLADVPASTVAADVTVSTGARTADAAPIHLIKTDAASVEQAARTVREGGADGLHLIGRDALAALPALRASYPQAEGKGTTARARLGLPVPVNPFAGREAA